MTSFQFVLPANREFRYTANELKAASTTHPATIMSQKRWDRRNVRDGINTVYARGMNLRPICAATGAAGAANGASCPPLDVPGTFSDLRATR